jgi:hypothetical protein
MSFSGTFGVGVLAPAITQKMTGAFLKNPILAKAAESFVVSACAALCVLPASAVFFGGISVLAPLTSVIILPFFTIAAGAMVLFSLLAAFPSAAAGFLLVAGVMSKIMGEIIGFLGNFNFALVSLDYWFVRYWLILAAVTVAAIRLIYRCNVKTLKAAALTIATLALMICAYNMNAVNSGRTYIKIYSDSVAAWVSVRQGNTEAVIVTADTPRAYEQLAVSRSSRNPTMTALLRSVRNNAAAFGGVTEKGIYDINGKFTLVVNAGKDETMLTIGDYSILFTRAANDNASPANVIVAYNQVRRKREFECDYVVYVSRSVPIEFEYERSAYFAPVYLMIENNRENTERG